MSKKIDKIIFRVNGNATIGYGHVIRSLALAEMLADDYDISFVCSGPDDFISARIQEVCKLISLAPVAEFDPADPRSESEIPFDISDIIEPAAIVITDGYRFGTHYRQAIRDAQAFLVCIEDMAHGFYPADLIVNPSPLIRETDYEALPNTRFCLGLKYALLRKNFREKPLPDSSNRNGTLLVMGGIDYFQLSPNIAEWLVQNGHNKIRIVSTSAYTPENLQRLQQLQAERPNEIELYRNLGPDQMLDVIDSCATAIAPASGILVESLKRELKCVVGYYATNQLGYYNYFAQQPFVKAVGDFRLKEYERQDVLEFLQDVSSANNQPLEIATADYKAIFHERFN